MKQILTLGLLLMSLSLLAQSPTLTGFYGKFTFNGFAAGGTADVTGSLEGFSDQTNLYFASDIEAGDVIWDNLGNRWEVMVVNSSNLTQADVDLRDVNSAGGVPFGVGYISRETPNLGLSLFVPDNNIGISQQLKSRVETHNALLIDQYIGALPDTVYQGAAVDDTTTVATPTTGDVFIAGDTLLFFDGGTWVTYTGGGGEDLHIGNSDLTTTDDRTLSTGDRSFAIEGTGLLSFGDSEAAGNNMHFSINDVTGTFYSKFYSYDITPYSAAGANAFNVGTLELPFGEIDLKGWGQDGVGNLELGTIINGSQAHLMFLTGEGFYKSAVSVGDNQFDLYANNDDFNLRRGITAGLSTEYIESYLRFSEGGSSYRYSTRMGVFDNPITEADTAFVVMKDNNPGNDSLFMEIDFISGNISFWNDLYLQDYPDYSAVNPDSILYSLAITPSGRVIPVDPDSLGSGGSGADGNGIYSGSGSTPASLVEVTNTAGLRYVDPNYATNHLSILTDYDTPATDLDGNGAYVGLLMSEQQEGYGQLFLGANEYGYEMQTENSLFVTAFDGNLQLATDMGNVILSPAANDYIFWPDSAHFSKRLIIEEGSGPELTLRRATSPEILFDGFAKYRMRGSVSAWQFQNAATNQTIFQIDADAPLSIVIEEDSTLIFSQYASSRPYDLFTTRGLGEPYFDGTGRLRKKPMGSGNYDAPNAGTLTNDYEYVELGFAGTYTLPDPATNKGKVFTLIADSATSGGNVRSVAVDNSGTIEGNPTLTLDNAYEVYQLVSSGSEYIILSNKP